MQIDDQSNVIEFLASPSTHGGSAVERIETHSAIVFLAGTRALKLKRAVRYDYLDFSTPDRRRDMCRAELRLNRRGAPDLYRGVSAVTREADGSLALDGGGRALDWVVDMNRFDEACVLDRLAARGALDLATMEGLAASVAAYHKDAERRPEHGGRANIAWVIGGNAAAYDAFTAILDPALCQRLTQRANAELARHAALLDARRATGFVRQCHGDLHLRNIVLLQGEPTLFDAIEFNDDIACIDTFYDVAFLLMDLWRRRLYPHANIVLNRYLADTTDVGGVALLPLFLSCRAAIRAKTSATTASLLRDAAVAAEWHQTARDYLALASRFLDVQVPALVGIGGLSGTGKSTVARSMAAQIGRAPGAVVLRSDEIRKELCGVPRLQRLGSEAYSADVSAHVYTLLADRASAVLAAGHSAIVDAVFGEDADREALCAVARRAGVAFAGLWLQAPEPVLVARVQGRAGDPSDADAGVVRLQQRYRPPGDDWQRIDASPAVGMVVQAAAASLQRSLVHAFHDTP